MGVHRAYGGRVPGSGAYREGVEVGGGQAEGEWRVGAGGD